MSYFCRFPCAFSSFQSSTVPCTAANTGSTPEMSAATAAPSMTMLRSRLAFSGSAKPSAVNAAIAAAFSPTVLPKRSMISPDVITFASWISIARATRFTSETPPSSGPPNSASGWASSMR